MKPRLLALPVVAAAALVLTGCITVQVPLESTPEPAQAATPSVAPSSGPTVTVQCTGDVVLDQSGADYDLGDCDRVTIRGNDIDLDARAIGELIIIGDRNDADVDGLGSLDVQGNDNEVDADDIGALTITGDRNDIDVDNGIASVVITGNDNDIEAAVLGTVQDNGRNTVRTD